MGAVLAYLARFLILVLAYFCAALTASTFLHLVLLGGIGWSDDQLPGLIAGSALVSVPVAALFISYYAFLPSLPLVLLTELLGWRDWLFFALAGGVLAAVLALLRAGDADAVLRFDSPFGMAVSLAAGVCAGIVYWAVAGRHAGELFSGPEPTGS